VDPEAAAKLSVEHELEDVEVDRPDIGTPGDSDEPLSSDTEHEE
jgi:hypothetical protein